MSDTELAVVEGSVVAQDSVGDLFRRATDVAGVCGAIVKATAQNIQGKQYVKVEGWQSIAVAFGCAASSHSVERVAGGFRAIGEVRRMSDGQVIATAEGFVSEDEPVWFGGGLNPRTGKPYEKRSESAIRCMAQTRSISRACRSALAFIVTLIDKNLSTTPAEEMDFVTVDSEAVKATAPIGAAALKAQLKPKPTPAAVPTAAEEPPPPDEEYPTTPNGSPRKLVSAPADTAEPRHHDGAMSFQFGRDKGVPLSQLDDSSLDFYAGAFRRELADATKAQWHQKTALQLAAVQAEMRFRGMS